MAPCLEDCPVEIIESIVVLLEDISDVGNLRLTCKQLAWNVAVEGGRYRSLFKSTHVDITERRLSALAEVTRPGHLGCLIEDLTIVGVVNNTKGLETILGWEDPLFLEDGNGHDQPEHSCVEEGCSPEKLARTTSDLEVLRRRQAGHEQLRKSGKDILLLSQAFHNLKENGERGRLRSLSLQIVVYRTDTKQRLAPSSRNGWKLVLRDAADTFEITCGALSNTGLPVEKLDMFSRLQCCSIPHDSLSRIMHGTNGPTASLAGLQTLSISLCDMLLKNEMSDHIGDAGDVFYGCDEDADYEEDVWQSFWLDAAEEKNYMGLADLLKCCPDLRELDVHYFRVHGDYDYDENYQAERLLQYVTESARLTRLHTCKLRGLWIREEHLLHFLKSSPIRDLTFQNLSAIKGEDNFRSVLDFCTSEEAGIQSLHFSQLFEPYGSDRDGFRVPRQVWFEESGWPKVRTGEGGFGMGEMLKRVDVDVKQPIVYRVLKIEHIRLPTPETLKSRAERRKEFGPP